MLTCFGFSVEGGWWQKVGIGVVWAEGDAIPEGWIVMLAVLRFNCPIFSNSLPRIMWPTSFVWQSFRPVIAPAQ